MNITPELALSALLIGLFGSVHCLGMCGGIAATVGVLGRDSGSAGVIRLLTYSLGRIASYCLAGALVGLLGGAFSMGPLAVTLRLFAALLLVAMGLYVGGWWQGVAILERLGLPLWRRVEPLAQSWISRAKLPAALWAGVLWGWLPCGLVYSTLVWAGATGGVGNAVLLMALFGAGTLPSMITAGMFARQFRRLLVATWPRRISGALIVLFGLATLLNLLRHLSSP